VTFVAEPDHVALGGHEVNVWYVRNASFRSLKLGLADDEESVNQALGQADPAGSLPHRVSRHAPPGAA